MDQQHTTLAITSAPFLASGASVSARLLTDTGTPVVGEPITFSATTVIYAATRFLVWAPNPTIGATVQFFGSDWSKQIADKDARKDFGDFKGFAETATRTTWTGRLGDKVKPRAALPRYIAVLLTVSASKTKDVLTGDVVAIAIVRVDSSDEKGKKPYDGKLGDRGVGTVVAVVPAG